MGANCLNMLFVRTQGPLSGTPPVAIVHLTGWFGESRVRSHGAHGETDPWRVSIVRKRI